MPSTDLKSGEEITDVGFFSSPVEEVYEGTDLEKLLDEMFARILENMANFTKGKSHWRFVQVNRLEIQADEMSRDDGVGEWVPLPEIFARKAKRKRKRHVNLFMIKKNGKKKHFCLISSLSRLLRKEKQKRQRYYCDNCLNSRQNKKVLEEHKKFCESFEPCNQLPPKDDFMQFKSHKNQTSIPFRIYADSEAILKPVSGKHGEFQEHIPCGFCSHTVCESGEEFSPVLIRGKNCVDEFLGKLIDHVKQLQNRPKKKLGERRKRKV